MLAYREVSGEDSDVSKHISPVAWQHINLYGRYEFNRLLSSNVSIKLEKENEHRLLFSFINNF